jgi:site-specific recombinase XerD
MSLPLYILELSTNSHSARTVSEYQKTVLRWQRSRLPPVDYLAGLRVKPASRTKEGIVLRGYLRWAVAHGFEPDNPLASIRFHAPAPPSIRPFSQAEVDALMAACRNDVEHAVILCLLRLGLRASELAGIRAGDVKADVVIIRKAKGGKERVLAVGPLLGPLEAICAAGLSYQGVYRMVKAVGRRAGVPGCHPHRFRHTFAHDFLAAGGDIGDLRVLLGHSSWGQTARYAAFYEGERAVSGHRRFLES